MPFSIRILIMISAVVSFVITKNAQAEITTVIGDKVGNGDFNADESNKEARIFNDTLHWFRIHINEKIKSSKMWLRSQIQHNELWQS